MYETGLKWSPLCSPDPPQRASLLVEVDYEPLPAILTIEQAIAAKSFLLPEPLSITRGGDVEKALAASPHTLEGEVRVGGQEQVCNLIHLNFYDLDFSELPFVN